MTPDDQIKPDDVSAHVAVDVSHSAQADMLNAAPTPEARWQALAEAVGSIVWMSDADGSGDWSGWRRYTGQTEAERSGWGWLDAIHPDDRARVRQAWGDALASQSSMSLAMRLRRVEGDYRIVRLVGAPVRGADGSVREWVGACIDVTDRFDLEGEQRRLLELERSARAEAQAVGAQLRAVLDVLPHGVIIADADGTLIMMNKALQTLWGEDAPLDIGIEGYRDYRAWWPATGERVTAEEWGMARALERRESVIAEELDIETFDGERKTILNSAAPVYDASGAFVGGVAVNVDITDRKRLEAELAHRLSEHESIFSAITDALFVYDADGYLVRMNTAARELLGMSADDEPTTSASADSLSTRAQRFNLRDTDGASLRDERWVVRRILHGESISPENAVDVLLTRLNGADARVSFTGAPIRDNTGTIIGAVSVGRDVTERRRLEDELRAANTQLASVSATLAQQAHSLETMNRRMDQFLGMANHEMKTPLTTLSANLQLATRRLRRLLRSHPQGPSEVEASPQSSREFESALTTLDRAQDAARRMTRLVNELLDISRIQTGRMEVHPEPCDLVALARGVVGEMRHSRTGRAIRLETQASSISVLADADRISEVIDNYLSNAVKYSPPDKPITLSLTTADDGTACVAVRDEGQGVSPEMQARIWNVFERLDSDAAQRTNGVNLGLGLHICKTIVELHGGRVGVENADDVGCTFWFTLPIAPTSTTA